MGYSDHRFQVTKIMFFFTTSLILLLSICLPTLEGYATLSPARTGLPPGDWDHVIITDQSLIRSFTPLAVHRTAQGLPSRIISTQELQRLSLQTNLRDAIRWFVSAAHHQWGTEYVLLGGDAEFIPVPLGYFESPSFSWDIPLDLYYAAPNGEWDLDGDGILGELEDDDPDLTPVVALGRAPVSDPGEVAAFVDKVIAFETQDAFQIRDVLLAAEVGSPYPWQPGMDVQFDFAMLTEEIIQVLEPLEFFGAFDRLYQNWEARPGASPLTPTIFLEALNSGNYRFLSMLIHAIAETWSMGPDFLRPEDLGPLEEMDHSLFMVPGAPQATDCRPEGVLENLLVMPRGGCVGAVGPSSMFFILPGEQFIRGFWQGMVDSPHQRVGAAYRQALVDLIEDHPPGSLARGTFMCMSIYGDPALLFLPVTRDGPGGSNGDEMKIVAGASPNPFNPATEISFTLPGSPRTTLPTVVEIFDLRGRRLTRLVDDDLAPGSHSVRWRGEDDSGRSVGSGLFFARILAGDQRAVVKLILVE